MYVCMLVCYQMNCCWSRIKFIREIFYDFILYKAGAKKKLSYNFIKGKHLKYGKHSIDLSSLLTMTMLMIIIITLIRGEEEACWLLLRRQPQHIKIT